MPSPKILLVEDDPALRTITSRVLQQNGYRVLPVGSGGEMWTALKDGPADLILLDIMLPGGNGIDLCRQLRQEHDIPIIFISARGTETDRVVGLEVGADDYLVKPFSTRELVARIRAVLRRGHPVERKTGGEERLQFDGWTVSISRRELFSPTGAYVSLTGAEFDLLASFLENPQRIIARERLIELSRTRLGDTSDRSVDVLVSRLRRKLSVEGSTAPIITIRGVGYMFNTEVTQG